MVLEDSDPYVQTKQGVFHDHVWAFVILLGNIKINITISCKCCSINECNINELIVFFILCQAFFLFRLLFYVALSAIFNALVDESVVPSLSRPSNISSFSGIKWSIWYQYNSISECSATTPTVVAAEGNLVHRRFISVAIYKILEYPDR